MKTRSLPLPKSLMLVVIATLALAALSAFPAPAYAEDPQFTFNGGGWGHGVGLSQWGARGYALKGWTYDSIIKHYYQGTDVVTTPTVMMRVNLDASSGARSQWWIKAGSDTTLTVKQLSDKNVKLTLTNTDSYWITTQSGNTRVQKDEAYAYTNPTTGAKSTKHRPGSILTTFAGACYATAGGKIQMLGTSGPYGHTGVKWRGYVWFVPGSATASTSKAINYVNIEDYLYGVVPRESPASWPIEALKAQAVAARSYAYQDGLEKRTIHCTTRSQVYNGYLGPKGGESASSNAAVDATRGQVVWYGAETAPVKTYFSSCTGGHTASIEDVWTTSAPKPYYTGVVDADEESPYFTWKLGPYPATYVSDKIRARDLTGGGGLDYSVAAPAIITDIAAERAASGFTHHVTLTWSTGEKYRIPGDTMRSTLGMKSTKFEVVRTDPVSTNNRYENSDGQLAWYGYWKTQNRDALSAGSLHYSSVRNASMTSAFTGTGVALIGTKGPKFGKASIYVDGTLAKTIDLYSSTTKYRQTLYKNAALAAGSHTITVKVLRTRSTASAGYLVGIDALDVYNGTIEQATPPLRRFEDTRKEFVLLGDWKTYDNAAYSAGRHRYTVDPQARFYARFYGSEVYWIGSASPKYGWALVSIDGGPAEKVVITTAGGDEHNKVLFGRAGLAQSSAHTIMIEAHGYDPAAAPETKGYTAVDAIDVRGGWIVTAVLPRVTVQESNAAVRWKGTWKSTRSTQFSGGKQRWSKTRGSAATLTFEGTGVTLIGRRASGYGKSKIYLDGVYQGTVDQYGAKVTNRRNLWSSAKLAAGRHTLRVVVLGTKRAAAKGTAVGVDAFEVTGRPITP